jgi:predicted Zn-dependent protease
LKNQIFRSFISALLVLLAGCASVTTQPPGEPTIPAAKTPQETAPQGMTPQEMAPPPGQGVITPPEPKPVMSGNRAVIALLDQAQLHNDAGQREAAGASLERALRIEPRNPWLWHELAQLRLTQGQYGQAVSLARKSTSFSVKDRHLQALNWRLIGNARVAQGDTSAAEQAFKTATELE